VLIGDSWRDIEAANAAGLTKSYFLSDNRITAEQLTTISSSHRVSQVKRLSEILVSGYV